MQQGYSSMIRDLFRSVCIADDLSGVSRWLASNRKPSPRGGGKVSAIVPGCPLSIIADLPGSVSG